MQANACGVPSRGSGRPAATRSAPETGANCAGSARDTGHEATCIAAAASRSPYARAQSGGHETLSLPRLAAGPGSRPVPRRRPARKTRHRRVEAERHLQRKRAPGATARGPPRLVGAQPPCLTATPESHRRARLQNPSRARHRCSLRDGLGATFVQVPPRPSAAATACSASRMVAVAKMPRRRSHVTRVRAAAATRWRSRGRRRAPRARPASRARTRPRSHAGSAA